jgi:hypothetical protein
MANDPTQPATPVPVDGPANRRRFLQALGAATVYVPPALVALLGDVRPARARSVTGGSTSSESSETSQVEADPGNNQTVAPNRTVELDGTGSTNSLGGELEYEWAFDSKPAGSEAVLVNASTATPTFYADVEGDYVVRLKVTGYASSGESSAVSHEATVIISTINSAPIADAGDPQTAHVGAPVTLDGTQSYDPDGHDIAYSWSLRAPEGSQAVLSGPTTPGPSFTPDLFGTYTATLVVTDGYAQSQPSDVVISTSNSAPVAHAGLSQSAPIGATVTLDGTGSSDADGDALTYSWSIVSAPTGSTSAPSDPHGPIASLIPDTLGLYVVGLIVNDGLVASAQATAQVLVFDPGPLVTEIQQLQQHIFASESSYFRNRNMQNTLLNKLNAVIKKVSNGNLADALSQLRDDVLQKVSASGGWITHTGTQAGVYGAVDSLIADIEAFL